MRITNESKLGEFMMKEKKSHCLELAHCNDQNLRREEVKFQSEKRTKTYFPKFKEFQKSGKLLEN